jgi:hypothetical protein
MKGDNCVLYYCISKGTNQEDIFRMGCLRVGGHGRIPFGRPIGQFSAHNSTDLGLEGEGGKLGKGNLLHLQKKDIAYWFRFIMNIKGLLFGRPSQFGPFHDGQIQRIFRRQSQPLNGKTFGQKLVGCKKKPLGHGVATDCAWIYGIAALCGHIGSTGPVQCPTGRSPPWEWRDWTIGQWQKYFLLV